MSWPGGTASGSSTGRPCCPRSPACAVRTRTAPSLSSGRTGTAPTRFSWPCCGAWTDLSRAHAVFPARLRGAFEAPPSLVARPSLPARLHFPLHWRQRAPPARSRAALAAGVRLGRGAAAGDLLERQAHGGGQGGDGEEGGRRDAARLDLAQRLDGDPGCGGDLGHAALTPRLAQQYAQPFAAHPLSGG